jgi:hypothetical protein
LFSSCNVGFQTFPHFTVLFLSELQQTCTLRKKTTLYYHLLMELSYSPPPVTLYFIWFLQLVRIEFWFYYFNIPIFICHHSYK